MTHRSRVVPAALRRTLPALLIGLAGACPVPAAADPLALPDMGDPSGQTLSPATESALGEAFMQQLLATTELVEDPELDRYIAELGARLVAASDAPDRAFHFFLVRDPSINAFAAPGGHIGLHTGLLLAARSESELAAVLAHEIAHVTQRHLARAYDSASRMSLPTAAAILAAILIGTQNSEAGQAALMTVQAGSIQKQIDFTRGNEREADRIGMRMLARTGFDPLGMPAFFERLQAQTRYYGDRIPPFLSTHPVTRDRIADAQARADQLRPARPRDELDFHLMRMRLRVLESRDPARLHAELAAGETGLPESARSYGLALAELRNGAPERAQSRLAALHRADPDRLSYRLALAKALDRAGRRDAALRLYRDTLALYPGNLIVARQLARALLDGGQPRAAHDLLDPLLRQNSSAPAPAYALLGRAARAIGRSADAHEAMAEFHARKGQLHAAIEQLKLALEADDADFYQRARLEARLAALERQALARKNALKGE